MSKKTGNPMGRPPKTEEERVVVRQYSLARQVAERLEAKVPRGERSAFVQQAIVEKLEPEAKEGSQ